VLIEGAQTCLLEVSQGKFEATFRGTDDPQYPVPAGQATPMTTICMKGVNGAALAGLASNELQ
jgi:hypothetical protein